jgi:porphobilinogen synthase
MSFPLVRMRRLRKTPAMRRLVAETVLTPADLIYPMFVCPGQGVVEPIGSMPGVNRIF